MTDTITLYELDVFGQRTGETRTVDPAAGWASPWFYAPEPPPEVDAGQAAILVGEAWKVVERQEDPASIEPARRAKRLAIDVAFLTRNTANFPWDFGAIEALDDLGVSVGAAGVRSLQIRDMEDKTNWTAAHTVAMSAVALGAPATIVPLKCDDNVWVQTTALQVMQVLALGEGGRISLFSRQAANLARYGALKKPCAEAADQADLDAIDEGLIGGAGWPPNLGEEA